MKEAFKRLKKHRRGYLICSVGQKYINMVESLVYQIEKYSQYPVFLYYNRGTVNFDSPALIKQRFELLPDVDYEIGGLYTSTKVLSCKLLLENYDIDEFIFLDSDILITPVIDSVFIKYSGKVNNYPLFIRYSWQTIFAHNNHHVVLPIQDRLGVNETMRKIPSLCTCFFIANKNCKIFIDEWSRFCVDKELIKKFKESPELFPPDFNDEPIANALVWKFGGEFFLPTNLMWSWNETFVNYAFDLYEGKRENINPRSPDQPSHYQFWGEFEVWSGLTLLNESKQNFWGTHFIKHEDSIREAAEVIQKRF